MLGYIAFFKKHKLRHFIYINKKSSRYSRRGELHWQR